MSGSLLQYVGSIVRMFGFMLTWSVYHGQERIREDTSGQRMIYEMLLISSSYFFIVGCYGCLTSVSYCFCFDFGVVNRRNSPYYPFVGPSIVPGPGPGPCLCAK